MYLTQLQSSFSLCVSNTHTQTIKTIVANIDFHPVYKLSSREALSNCVQFTSQRLNDKVRGGIGTSLMRTDADRRRPFV